MPKTSASPLVFRSLFAALVLLAMMVLQTSAWSRTSDDSQVVNKTTLHVLATNKCGGCHGSGATTVAFENVPAAMNRGDPATLTLRVTNASAASTARLGANIATSASAGTVGTLAVEAGQAMKTITGTAGSLQLIHDSSLGLPTFTTTSRVFTFRFTMPAGATVGSSHTIYGVAAAGFAGSEHAPNAVIKVRPISPATATASNATAVSVDLSWTGSTGPHYRIVYKTGAAAPTSPTDGTATAVTVTSGSSTTITGLSPSTQYSFAVFGKLDAEDIFSSSSATVTVSTTTPVVAPRYVNGSLGVNTGACTSASNPCKTITYAMAQAVTGAPGDPIHVAPGTYNVERGESFPIVFKSGVQLKSTAGAESTIIDATGANSRVMTMAAPNASSVLEGFTLMGGLHNPPADGSNATGGGLYIDGGHPTVRKNIFMGNEARGYTGAGSTYVSGGPAYGGGVYVNTAGAPGPVIVNNVFRNNIARGGDGKFNVGSPGASGNIGSSGGLAYAGTFGNGTVNNNTFHGNQAIGGNGGGSNISQGAGGTAYYGGASISGAAPNNNIFSANAAIGGTGNGGQGSAIDGGADMFPFGTNNLYHGNTANGSPNNGSRLGNSPVCISPACSGVGFHAAPDSLRITPTSPAVGTGASVPSPTDDFDGVARAAPPAVGAFEPSAFVSGARFVDDSGADTGDCRTSGSPCKTITYAMSRAATGNPGDVINVAPGTYNVALGEVFPIRIKTGVQLKASGNALNTIIDATGANDRVLEAHSVNNATLVQGFTITGGLFPSTTLASAGGMLIVSGSPTIQRNVFLANEATGTSALGGGLVLRGGAPTIQNNVFRGNVARGSSSYGQAGGAHVSGSAKVLNNTFYANQAIGATAQAGGLSTGAAEFGDSSVVNNNILANNSATGSGGGGSANYGGLFYSDADASHNLLHANTANAAASTGDTIGSNSRCFLTPCASVLFHAEPGNLRIQPGSPANGNGLATGAPTDDFDGSARPAPPAIGAFEASTPSIVYNMVLEGWQQVAPYVVTAAGGTGTATYNTATRALTLNLPYSGLSSAENGAHIHGPAARGANAGVLFTLGAGSPKTDTVTLSPAQETQLFAGELYVNIHTANFAAGEIRAQIDNVGATMTRLLTISKAGTGGGTVTGTGEPGTVINCGGDCTETVPNGKVVTLTATAAAGSSFSGWSGGGCSGTGNCAVTMSAAITVTATFTLNPPGPAVSLSTTAVAFGAQSMGTTSPASTVTLTNSGNAALTVTGITVNNAQFSQAHNCTTVAAGASCGISVFFSPAVAAGALNSTAAVTGSLSIASNAPGSAHAVSLSGTAEKSLVAHYYGSILNRAPDATGKNFWDAEATRLAGLGVNVNEIWFLMANYFFNSVEYASFNRSDTAFLNDVYRTFFNRAPDGGGAGFWQSQMNAGLSREGVIFWFVFSNEFRAFAEAIFGSTAARPEVDMVMDLFRGILNRFPETAALNAYVGTLRQAQCAAADQRAGAVYKAVNDISYFFLGSAEYGNRARTNQQFVSDMYNAFLRRGGTDDEVDFWINQLNSSASDRNNMRASFIASPEFGGRVNAVINAGCVQ